MPSKIWNKYKIIKEIEDNSHIKTYLTKIEPIVKEIIPKNKEDYFIIMERLERLKLEEELNIYEIIEEDNKIYIVIDNNNELLSKIDKLILSDELDIKKEVVTKGHGSPIKKDEIFNLFKMEKSMCKISLENMKGEKCHGSGFFCEIDFNFPIKYALFTNNHVLNELNIEIGKTIHFEYLEFQKSLFNSSYNTVKKKIKITDKRKVFTNKELDYTCIELYESDGILDYFKIDSNIFKYNKNDLINNDIFILQFPNGNDLSFSYGSILSLKDNTILHSASTEGGSSGSPIIKRSNENYIIGLHYGGIKNKYNLATCFNSILDNIKEQNNEINCIYIIGKNETEINLLHDYNLDINEWDENMKKIYLDAKNYILEMKENIEIYVNDKKIKFNFKYKIKESKELKVKFKLKKLLSNTSYMFDRCSSLKSIDLSSFNTTNVKDMRCMFFECSSLKSIDLSSFNTTNVFDMSYMFKGCSSLNSIDLSSFNTTNVNYMSYMFKGCSSLKSIDLSSFNTSNVYNMSEMFSDCSSLKTIDLSSFNTSNVYNMYHMFFKCSSLKSIDLSSFNTTNVNDMGGMFWECSSLKSIDISSFNTTNVFNMYGMFSYCSSLNSIDLSSFNTTNVYYMSDIFFRCSSLKKENIKIKNKNDKILNELSNI